MNLKMILSSFPVVLALLCIPQTAVAFDTLEITVNGVAEGELQNDIRAASVLQTLRSQEAPTGDDIVAAARSDYAAVVETLYAAGYYSVSVSIRLDGREAALIDPLNAPPQIERAEIRVEPGRLFRFGRLQLGPLADRTTLPERFARDRTASAELVRQAVRVAVRDWREVGHAKAGVASQSVLARHEAARLDVEIRLDPGPLVTFGEVVVSGQTAVRERNIRRIAAIPEGDVFDPEAVDAAGERLRKTGTFASVEVIESDAIAPDGSMDIEISVVDQKPRRIGGGIEYSNFDGLTLQGYWLHRNLLGGAERFRLEAEIAQIDGSAEGVDYSLSFRLEKPAAYGPDTLFFVEAGLFYVDEPEYLEERGGVLLGLSREFTEQLTGELGIGFYYSRVTDRFTLPETTRELRILSLPVSVTYDRRNDPLDPSRGIFLDGSITPYIEAVEREPGVRMTLDARSYRQLGEAVVLAGRLQLGALVGPDGPAAPPDSLFYSGGGGTVRGQPYKSLEADYGGVSLGGRSFAGLSGEIRFPVSDNLGLVAFADAGFVGSGFFDSGDWHAGAGLGARYQTPIGPIRFDLAGPIAGDTGDGLQIYVGIGQAF